MPKQSLEHYLNLNYRISVYRDEEGDYIAEIDDLPGCVADGETATAALQSLESAKRSWMESRLKAGLTIPAPKAEEVYSGRTLLRMPKSLHRKLAEQAEEENTSLNQYISVLLSEAVERRNRKHSNEFTYFAAGNWNQGRYVGSGVQFLGSTMYVDPSCLAVAAESNEQGQFGIVPGSVWARVSKQRSEDPFDWLPGLQKTV